MPLTAAAGNAAPGSDVGCYQRQWPEQTLLYRIVELHYPAFAAYYAAHGRAPAGRPPGMARNGALAREAISMARTERSGIPGWCRGT
jgi:hypothetical protein